LDEAQIATSARQLKEMMSFTDRANKRKYCEHLACFLTYCDYMTMTLLHRLLADTFRDLASVFRVHEESAPTLERIEQDQQTNAILEAPRESGKPETPLILAELLLKPEEIEIDPSR
jgi:dynein heavy chain, axonemal